MNILFLLIVAMITGAYQDPATASLQQNQRDTQAKTDVGHAVYAITAYQANNRGNLPPVEYIESGKFMADYLMPDDAGYYTLTTKGADKTGVLLVHLGTSCDGQAAKRIASVSTLLGDGERYCLDS